MTDQKWFILSQDVVRGPYDKSGVESALPSTTEPLIWGRGQTEWLPPDQWEKMLLDMESVISRAKQQQEREWRVRNGEQELPVMNYAKMLDYLRDQADHSNVLIWTEGYSEWKEIYQIHKLLDDLGVSRRRHPRVPIMGQVECEGPSGKFSARALSISEGGLGMTDSPGVKIGDKFKIHLKSPNLFAALHANAEVVFSAGDGYAGMKFTGLASEAKASIIEYVNKFNNTARSGTNA